ncbi:MAG: PAQR family membrane homeostasis protein TrhA [Bdellovibrio sp.]|jgi:hemolysin III
MVTQNPIVKPLLRGHFHQAAFFIAVGACSMLIANATGPLAIAATIIYSISLMGLLGISALYHRPQWQPHQRMWMRRLDHAAIFMLIAGTCTPLCLKMTPIQSGQTLLIMVWIAAGAGILQSLFWVNAPKWLAALLYIIVGWLAAPYLPELSQLIGTSGVALLMIGGVIYTIGAVVYALKKPNPFPKVFGYHEIFHLLVVIAAIFHFIVIVQITS